MNQKKRKNVIVVIVALIIALVIIPFMIFGLPRIIKGAEYAKVTNYLTNKYGDGSWQVTKKEDVLKKEQTNNGPRNRKTGDKYTISSSFLREKFTIQINDDGKVVEDYFLPAYYSEKYDISYYSETTQFGIKIVNHELYKRMERIMDYHYPNEGSVKNFYNVICEFFCEDNLPDFHRIPTMEEIITLIEDKCCQDKIRNTNNNDEEFYKLVFSNK